MRIKLFISLIIIPFIMNQIQAAEEVAKVAKARGQVQIKQQADVDFSSLKPGQSVFDGDIVKVGGEGFCIIVFLDDKSMLKIRESSQFQFMETANTRTINIEFGKVLADVKKDKRKDFRIETPVSVASVKGTQFWTVSNQMGFDKFYGLEGDVEVFNSISGQFQSLGPGQMTLSTATGQLVTSPASPEEVPDDPDDEEEEEPEEEPEEEEEEEEEESPEEDAEPEVEEEVIEEDVPEEEIPEEEMPENNPGNDVPDVEEEEEAPEPEEEGPFNLGAGLGSVTIDGVIYNQLALRPEIKFGKLGVGLDMVIYIDPQGNIRKDEWDEPTDFFDKILYVSWGAKGDPFFARYGTLENMTLGYGGLIYGYSNTMEFPEVRRIGLNGGMKFGKFGTELFVANFKDFGRGGGLVGGRITFNPFIKLVLGANVVMDLNQYSGLKDFDEDGVPDLLDDFPEEGSYAVDTDGDGIADEIDPDQDGDGYTDNSQDTSIVNNDPDGAVLKPDPFDIDEVDARSVLGLSVDAGYPVFSSKMFSINLYAEGNMLQFADDKSGIGLVPFGANATIFKIVNISFEYRMDSDFYAPRFFDQAYDLDRVVITEDSTGNLSVTTKDQELDISEGQRAGFYGAASLSLFNLVSASASYTDMSSDDGDTLRSFTSALALNTDNIPKISQAFAYYQRNNDDNPFDFANPSPNTILGYRVGYEVSAGVSLVWDYRRLHADLDGDGVISEDVEGEIINILNIETVFDF
ncbi:MAG TPA: FecR family protein [Candidatus Marinimicrobia bacterium]|nr:FecR family protein [Candidatus Neomarinimicrobiota bacterium]